MGILRLVGSVICKLDVNSLTGQGFADNNMETIVKNVVNTAMTVLAVVSVIMLIYGGYNYTTSGGDASKVTKAKNTILYAVIGLIIALLALAIVNFILGEIK